MKLQIAIGITTAIVWGLVIAMLFDVQGRNAGLELTVQAYKDKFAQRLGDDETYGVYRLLTLDGGLTWWQFETNELPDGLEAVMIIGRADAGLIRRLNKREINAQR